MNANYKLRPRQQKQQLTHRRIKTEANENPQEKKVTFYLNRPLTRQPLQENKKTLNQTDSLQPQQPSYSQIKRQKPIKSIAAKNTANTKLTTEPYEKLTVIPLAQRHAIDRIFETGKTGTTGRVSDLCLKKNVVPREKQREKGSERDRGDRDREREKQRQREKEREKQRQYIIPHKQQKPTHHPPPTRQYKQQQLQLSGQHRYAFQDKVGAGTFGIVHKARDKLTLQTVAIKRVYQDKKYKNRELQILKSLNHPNTLKMRDCFYTYEGDKEYLNVVMDYFDQNLYESVARYKCKGTEMPRLKVKVFAFQLFRSLLYLNKVSIAHRDIKPQNILVNDTNLKLVMCDFGSAKQLRPGEANIAYICSRCYRAPQLIFGNTNYTTQIDMWSAGCVLVEMITMEPTFRAESNIDQLVEIIKILGTPTYSEMLEMNPECDFQKYKLPKIGAKSWEKVIKRRNLGDEFMDLVKRVLQYSPMKRLTPLQALVHPFFDQLRQEQTYRKLKREFNIPRLFDFNQTKEVDADKIKYLVPSWYKDV